MIIMFIFYFLNISLSNYVFENVDLSELFLIKLLYMSASKIYISFLMYVKLYEKYVCILLVLILVILIGNKQ